jgi:AcrR family transcriptional regulator
MSFGGQTMAVGQKEDVVAKPLIPAEDILDRALELLDAEGPKALNVRRLSTDLKISPNTLYQQVGNQAELSRALVWRHFSQLKLDFNERDTWEATALEWCLKLHKALVAHPHLTELMTLEDRDVIRDYVEELLQSTLSFGIPRALALECCRGLTNLTINQSISEARAMQEHSPEATREVRKIEKNFTRVVRWVIAAVRAEAQGPPADTKTARRTSATAKPSARRGA